MENIMSSKLFTTRQGTILLGVIAAIIAAVALIVYLNSYRNSHAGNAAVQAVMNQRGMAAHHAYGNRSSRSAG